MPTSDSTQLRDIVWGGRIRPTHQPAVKAIASRAAHSIDRTVQGSMVHSTETVTYHFLDGGLSETRGGSGSKCGLRWFGQLAIAYMLYEMDLNPQQLLRDDDIPPKQQLEQRIQADVQAARSRATAPGGSQGAAGKTREQFIRRRSEQEKQALKDRFFRGGVHVSFVRMPPRDRPTP